MTSKAKAQGPEESSGSQKKAVQLLGPRFWVERLHVLKCSPLSPGDWVTGRMGLSFLDVKGLSEGHRLGTSFFIWESWISNMISAF